MMTFKEAHEILEAIDRDKLSKKAFWFATKAIKKRIPRIPNNLDKDIKNCPSCGYPYKTKSDYPYCPNCGQAIDWSVYEEDE